MTRHTKSKIEAIKPDQQDFDAVEKEYGPLPPNASQAALAERQSSVVFCDRIGRKRRREIEIVATIVGARLRDLAFLQ